MKIDFLSLIFILFIAFTPVLAHSEAIESLEEAQIIVEDTMNHIESNGVDKIPMSLIDRLMFAEMSLVDWYEKSGSKPEILHQIKPVMNQISILVKHKIPNFSNHLIHDIKDKNLEDNTRGFYGGSAQIKGVVRNSVTSEIITNAKVQLANRFGEVYAERLVDHNGRFDFYVDGGGEYYLAVLATGYIDQGYGGVGCHDGISIGCQVQDITMITMDVNDVVDGVDFDLTPTSLISGRIFNDENNLLPGFVYLIDEDTNVVSHIYVYPSDEGVFQIEAQEPGNYYLRFASTYHNVELYDDVVCDSVCDYAAAELIFLNGQTVSVGDVVLSTRKPISGTLTNAMTGLPVFDAEIIEFYDADTGHVKGGVSGSNINPDGSWTQNRSAGNYMVRVKSDQYLLHYADEQNCQSAQLASCEGMDINPTVFAHTANAPTNGIALKVIEGGTINGRVSYPGFNGSYTGDVHLYSELGELINTVEVSLDGDYTFKGVGNGTYYVSAKVNSYRTTAFPSYFCDIDPDVFGICLDVTNANPVTLVGHQTVDAVDISLLNGPSISGIVLDEQGMALGNISVSALSSDGTFTERSFDVTDANGAFQLNDLYVGDFILRANGRIFITNQSYDTEFYQDVICNGLYSGCDFSQVTPVTVSETIDYNGFIFDLAKKATVNLELISGSSNIYGYVSVYDSNGLFIEKHYVSSSGKTISLPEDGYRFLYTSEQSGYDINSRFISKVYGGSNCYSECDMLSGTLLAVESNQSYDVILDVDKSYEAEIIVDSNLPNDLLIVYQDGQLVVEKQIYGLSTSVSLNLSGDINLGVRKDGFYYQFYGGNNCIDLSCALNQAADINTAPFGLGVFNFTLQPLTSVTGKVMDEQGNPIFKNVRLVEANQDDYVFSSANQTSSGDGTFEFVGVPEGLYHIYSFREFNNDEHANGLYGGVYCAELDQCDFSAAQIIEVSNNNFITDVDFYMPEVGKIRIENTRYTNGDPVQDIEFWVYHLKDGRYQYFHWSDMQSNQIALIDSLYQNDYKLMAVHNLDDTYYKTVYPNISCQGLDTQTCLAMGTSISVEFGETTQIDDFVVDQVTSLSVHVQDAESGLYLPGYRVNLYQQGAYGWYRRSAFTSDAVLQIPISHVEAYYLEVEAEYNDSHIGMLYENIPCELGVGESCQLEQGTLISGNLGDQIPVFVQMISRPDLSIEVKDMITNYNIPSELIFTDLNGNFFNTYQNEFGSYHLNMSAGEYHVKANSFGYISSPETLIEVLPDGSSNYDLELRLRWGVGGYVVEAETGAPVMGANIDFWDSSGQFVKKTQVTSATGGFSINENIGPVRVSTDILRPSLLYDEVYNNHQCLYGPAIQGLCDIQEGNYVTTNFGRIIYFELESDLIFKQGFEY